MNPETAETIALQAIAWLATNDELCPVFLGATGGTPDDMRDRISDPAFQAAVLDFVTMDDAWVIAFCDTINIAYEQPMIARNCLPGAEVIHWT